MLHKNVRHEVGLTAVMGAFMLSWIYAGLPALQASVVAGPMAYYNELPVAVANADQDRDGIPDGYDATPIGARR